MKTGYFVVAFDNDKIIVVPGTKENEVYYALTQHWIYKHLGIRSVKELLL